MPYTMSQAGHSDPKMTLGIYASVIASKTDHGASMDELVHGAEWHEKALTPISTPDLLKGP